MIAPPGYYTVEQVAALLGCSKSTVYRIIRTDGLTSRMRRGHERGMLIKQDDLESWINRQYEGACTGH